MTEETTPTQAPQDENLDAPRTFRYYYQNRPPAYAHQPEGFTARDGGLPKQEWKLPDGRKYYSFGWVEYPKELSFETCWKWKLIPADISRLGYYMMWKHCERNTDEMDALIADYSQHSNETLKEWREDGNPYADALLLIRGIA